MRRLFSVASLVLLASLPFVTGVFAKGSPQFSDYPAVVERAIQPVAVKLKTADSRKYASALKEAAKQPPNFAGHFVLATMGCGAGCVAVGAIDAKTGRVTMLPFTVSDWPLDVIEPVSFRSDSRLMVVQGSRNENGHGKYFYDFDGVRFKLVGVEHEIRK